MKRSTFGPVVACMGLLTAACGIPQASPSGAHDGEVNAAGDGGVNPMEIPRPPPGAPVTAAARDESPCPGAAGSNRRFTDGPGDHARATQIVRYLFGDVDAIPGSACQAVRTALDAMRARIESGASVLTLHAKNVPVCGLPANLYRIANEAKTFAQIGPRVDECVGLGTAPFRPPSDNGVDGFVAPQIAELTQSFGAETAPTATAVWADTGAATTVCNWPHFMVSGGAHPPTSGQPCNAGALASGQYASGLILASRSQYMCL